MRYPQLIVSVLALSLVVELTGTQWIASILADPKRFHPFYGSTRSIGTPPLEVLNEPNAIPAVAIPNVRPVAFQISNASSDDLAAIIAELEKLKRLRPKTAEEFCNQQLEIRTFTTKALQHIADPNSEEYLKIERDWILSSTLLLYQANVTHQTDAPSETTSVDAILESWRNYSARRKTLDLLDLRLISSIAKYIETNDTPHESIKCYEFFLDQIYDHQPSSTNVGVQIKGDAEGSYKQLEVIFTGAVRRLNLVGSPLKLSGRTFGGEDFNIESYRGKVVLVDYWATWCGPCVAEYPQIRALWEKYHASGFEVVGVSMDDERESLANYIKEKSVPWVILNDEKQGGKHPSTEYYNIQTVPTMFLIGRDGNVISTKVEVSKLEMQLKEALGKN